MRYITYILLTAFVSLLMASCELEASSHGNLYGFWHLETIETIESGSTKDMRDELKFWSVQSKLIELSDHDGVHNSVLYHFQREGDSLFLFDPHFNLREESDPVVDELYRVQPYGLAKLLPRLRIDHLTSGELTVSGDGQRLKFTKF
ncbi:MAG: lipocalin-like domain-containing protein [Prevotella sp.]|nr:lipocalin-like domain-containing protein [Prevotella sp.]